MESSRGGNPAIFVLGKRGPLGRLPRGLEIALQSMAEGEISSFTLKPSLGFGHPDCTWRLGGAHRAFTIKPRMETTQDVGPPLRRHLRRQHLIIKQARVPR